MLSPSISLLWKETYTPSSYHLGLVGIIFHVLLHFLYAYIYKFINSGTRKIKKLGDIRGKERNNSKILGKGKEYDNPCLG